MTEFSAVLRIRIELITLMRIRMRTRILIFILYGSGSDFSHWSGSRSGPRSWLSNKGSNPWKSAKIISLACHLQTDADPDPVPDPADHFHVDPDADFYLMRMRIRIQVTKMMRIYADPDTQHWFLARICKPFKEPRNRFPAWRAGTKNPIWGTLVPARQASSAGWIDSLELIPGLLKRLQIYGFWSELDVEWPKN